MLHSSSTKVLLVMQVSAQHKCRCAGNMVQNNADNGNGNACTTN